MTLIAGAYFNLKKKLPRIAFLPKEFLIANKTLAIQIKKKLQRKPLAIVNAKTETSASGVESN